MHSVPDAKREFSPRGGARALGTLLPLPLRVYEASKALIYSCMTIALMRPTHFSPAAPYARLHVSSVRTPTDVTGAARHAHIRFMRAHGRPARANSDSIRPGTRENGHRTGHAAHTLHRPAMTGDTARPLGAMCARYAPLITAYAATLRRVESRILSTPCQSAPRSHGKQSHPKLGTREMGP